MYNSKWRLKTRYGIPESCIYKVYESRILFRLFRVRFTGPSKPIMVGIPMYMLLVHLVHVGIAASLFEPAVFVAVT